MTNVNIPKCPTCDAPYGVVIGLPVIVTFTDDGVATVSVDLGELSDTEVENVTCDCNDGPQTSDLYGEPVPAGPGSYRVTATERYLALAANLEQITASVTLSVDYTLQP